ncbi:NEW3 domain-containing protein [Brevibacillus massiliensis]|jgi:uncharacterized membrane protein|uniref:COG1470 family protein n=1 Tax=Brevibacillus massiliensis TaxID=1118054 RepID=UPI0003104F03|nr:NEW3 domain-containing protein [Brevibacillus massiliensis]
MAGTGKRTSFFLLTLLLILAAFGATGAFAAGGISVYTPLTNISVTPGESINYSVDVINNTSEIQNVALAVTGLPDKWEAKLTSDGWSVSSVSVKPNSSYNLSLQVDVPLQVDKGAYHFQLNAGGKGVLPLTVNVSEQGTYKTELTSEQPNMEGHANSTFNYQVTLRNRTAQKQLYALTAGAPQGWDVQFKTDGKSVTSVNVDAGAAKDIDVEVHPPEKVKSGTYKIPLKAATNSSSAETGLEVVITGSYSLELSTPSGVLSTDVTAGGKRTLQLKVTNTGSADLRNLDLTANTPVNWEVTFEPKKIPQLAAGQSEEVTATIKADDKAIAGDYVVGMTAGAPEATADAQFRVTVKTSLLWGWLGVLIVAAVIGGVYYLFRTYGRR